MAARAGYCQDRQSFTRNGTFVDLFDTRQFVWPNAIENPLSRAQRRLALDVRAGVLRVVHAARVGPEPQGHGAAAHALARAVARGPVRELRRRSTASRSDHFEDARWANPLTSRSARRDLLAELLPHNEAEIGAALPWDCSPCTTAVCRKHPALLQRRPDAAPAGLGRVVRRRARRSLPGRRRAARAVVAARQGLAARRRAADGAAEVPHRSRAAPSRRTAGVSTGGTSATVHGLGLRSRVAGHGRPRRDLRRRAARARRHAARHGLRRPGARGAARRRGGRRLRRARPRVGAARLLVHAAAGDDGQRLRLRARHGDGRRTGRAADAAPQRHRPRADAAITASTSRARRSRARAAPARRPCARRAASAAAARRLDRRLRGGRRGVRARRHVRRRRRARLRAGPHGLDRGARDGHVRLRGRGAAEPRHRQRPEGRRLVRRPRPDERQRRPPAGRPLLPPLGSLPGGAAGDGHRPGPHLATARRASRSSRSRRAASTASSPARARACGRPTSTTRASTGASAVRLDATVDQSTTTVLPAGVLPPTYSIHLGGRDRAAVLRHVHVHAPRGGRRAPRDRRRVDRRRPCRSRRRSPRAAPHDICALGDKLTASHDHAGGLRPVRRRDLRQGSVLLRRRLPLVLLDRARVGREVRHRGRDGLRPHLQEPAAEPDDAGAPEHADRAAVRRSLSRPRHRRRHDERQHRAAHLGERAPAARPRAHVVALSRRRARA